jgi:hypothetical protein
VIDISRDRVPVYILLFLAAVSSLVFTFMVESFNDLTLDDIGFFLQIQDKGIWKFVYDVYINWQGRFTGFFITGLQLKSYSAFGTMLPASIILYVLNILLVFKSLHNIFNRDKLLTLLVAVILFQLYVYSMLDISSYFWLCTKGYSFTISLCLFAFSGLFTSKFKSGFDYFILFLSFVFLGCSTEIFSPVILVFFVTVLIIRFYRSGFNISSFFLENKAMIFSFVICFIFFILMIIAPGNKERMNATRVNINIEDYLTTASKNGLFLFKMVVLRFYYFIAAAILVLVLVNDIALSKFTKRKIFHYTTLFAGTFLISVLLYTYAGENKIALRAFNHLNLAAFLLTGVIFCELWLSGYLRRSFSKLLTVAILFVVICNIYCIYSNINGLVSYRESVQNRLITLQNLQSLGNKETVKMEPLNAAEYRSIDNLWKRINPNINNQVLLKPNEVSADFQSFYNESLRSYYNLDFNIITDLKNIL